MKNSQSYILAGIPLLLLFLIAAVYNNTWLSYMSEFLAYLAFSIVFYRKLDRSSINLLAYLGLSMVAVLFKCIQGIDLIFYLVMLLQVAAYIFLSIEAMKYTQREYANKYMLLFFFLMISANIYFVFDHFQELGSQIGGMVELVFYSIYYIALLSLAIVALIYYLNSYSRKSVFFVTLVMSLVISDILRDMAMYYFADASVLFLECFLRFAGVLLAFIFFGTEEKKLKLINLV